MGRFGALPAYAEDKLKRATGAELDLWAERVLGAASIEDVFGGE